MTFTSRVLRASGLLGGIAVMFLLASCSQESRVLARVGDRTITVAEFEDVARTAREQYPWLPDSAKRVLLDDMIRRELMLLEADARGITKDTLLNVIRRNAEEGLLVSTLTEQFAPRGIPVSTAEAAAYYDWHKTESEVQVIYAASLAGAAAAKARIDAGTSFDEVALTFNARGPVPPDGNVGFIPGGGLMEPLDSAVRTAKVGEVVGPLRVGPSNWFLFRVRGRRAAQLPPFATVQEDLRSQLSQRKGRARVERLVQSLSTQYQIEVDPDATAALYMRGQGVDTTSGLSDHRIVLGRYQGVRGPEAYTMADAMHDLESTEDRPDFSNSTSLQRWIESRIMRRVVLTEARRYHLNEEPRVVRRVRQQADQAVLQSIYDTETSRLGAISDADLEAEYYRRSGPNPPPFSQIPPQLREQLRQIATEKLRDDVLRRFTDNLRRKYPVTVNEALLQRIAWPLPGVNTPQPAQG